MKTILMTAARLLIICDMSSTEGDERYEVVVKHYLKGVLHRASFKTGDQARDFLMARWAELPVKRGEANIDCGAAIYDTHESRKRIFTLGAAYLADEDREHEP
jgi:hypothetical protein